jgi:hypothetical protein
MARCLSSTEVNAIRSRAAAGASLVLTGETGRYDETGESRRANPIHQLLGLKQPGRRTAGTRPFRFLYDPACPGRAYWRLLEEEFDSAGTVGESAGRSFEEFRDCFAAELAQHSAGPSAVDVEASPFVAAHVARVTGKARVFLANFAGLRSKENATQLPERDVRIAFAAKPGARIRMLPFLGAVQDVKTDYADGKAVCTILQLNKGAVVWIE